VGTPRKPCGRYRLLGELGAGQLSRGLEQRIFRVRTLAAAGFPRPKARTDVALQACSLAQAKRLAERIADAEPLWRDGDLIEILDADGRTILIRDKRWQPPASAPLRRVTVPSTLLEF
jgi:hypothetical protein